MRRYLYNPDIGSIVMSGGFTVASMGLSAYCGWNIADGSHIIMKVASAIMFSLVAFGLSIYVVRRERYKLSRDKPSYDGARRIVWFLLIANLLTDYSASAALRNLTNTKANNVNTVAKNARTEVAQIESRMKDLKAEKAWRQKYNAPESYDALINAQKQIAERGRNIWRRSKQCTDTTLASSSVVCSKIDNLKAERANAQRRQVVLAELKTLAAELKVAKEAVKKNGITANAALAPIVQLVNMLTLSLDNDKSEIQWGQNFFVLFFTLVITAAIYFSSADLGRRMGPMPAPVPRSEMKPEEPDNWWIEDQRPKKSDEPIPLKAEPVTYSSTARSDDPDAWKESMDALDKVLARVQAKRNLA